MLFKEQKKNNELVAAQGQENQKNQENQDNQESLISKCFNNASTLPYRYLPKKKKLKLEKSGKTKLPAAGSPDQWLKYHEEKEKELLIKEQKAVERKILQEEKRKLAAESNRLKEKMQEIQKKLI